MGGGGVLILPFFGFGDKRFLSGLFFSGLFRRGIAGRGLERGGG